MIWDGWGVGMMIMMLLFSALIIVGVFLSIRWLVGLGRETRSDSALETPRQRYARGEINQDEFETMKQHLAG